MPFDFRTWKAVVLGSAEKVISLNDLLEASGLTDADYLEDDIAFLMRDIEADLNEAERRRAAARSSNDSLLTYAIGDIHGRLDLLQALAVLCLVDAAQRGCEAPLYVFLGDYIDRGPGSAGVIRFLREFSDKHCVVALRGNHDQMMVGTVLGQDDGASWIANGMATTAASYGYSKLVQEVMSADEKQTRMVEVLRLDPQVVDDARWLAGLPLWHEDERRYFVHAGIRPGVPLGEQSAHDLLWIRYPFLRQRKQHPKLVVHGHTMTPDQQPEVRSNRIGLDTGAVWSGRLTAGVFGGEQARPIAFLNTGP